MEFVGGRLNVHFSVKTFVNLVAGCFVIAMGLTAQAQAPKTSAEVSPKASDDISPKASSDISPKASSEIFCGINEFRDGFPVAVRFQIRGADEIEVRSTDRRGVESAKAILKRIEIASQPKVAVFSIGGSAGVSGEAKLLLTKDALKFGEVSTMMIVNQTMRESGIYQCRKLPGSF